MPANKDLRLEVRDLDSAVRHAIYAEVKRLIKEGHPADQIRDALASHVGICTGILSSPYYARMEGIETRG